MKRMLLLITLAAGIALVTAARAGAHCDAIDGPVAGAAARALATDNVNLALPWVPAEAEAELEAAFAQARVVRRHGGEAQALADRFFMETAVRLHRAGEHAPYTGLKPAGTDFGPAIPAAERAVASGDVEPVLGLLNEAARHGVIERWEHVKHAAAGTAPARREDVAAARERVHAELGFVTYVQGLYEATKGAGHAD